MWLRKLSVEVLGYEAQILKVISTHRIYLYIHIGKQSMDLEVERHSWLCGVSKYSVKMAQSELIVQHVQSGNPNGNKCYKQPSNG